MRKFKKISIVTLIVTSIFISVYRINIVKEDEISWDVLGYYLYLPATFIYHDYMLTDISWLKKINAEKNLTGTLYMVSENKKGEPMYFFLMGMSIFYLPFFIAGHVLASALGYSPNGFSQPYQYLLVIGGILYTIIGLIYLRKILKHFFSEGLTSIIMIIIVFGTNYINHLTIKNLETVNVLFMLTSIILWNTIKWHEENKNKNIIVIGISVTLATLIKPSEVFVLLIPLLWNVTTVKDFKEKILKLITNKKGLLITIGISILLILPQMMYWYIKTGNFIYDSYKNAGVGLDYLSPHIISILFSYRKGWLLYTPIMIFSLIGFYFLYKNNKHIIAACMSYFAVSFYIIASWTEWWYGAGFSTRPLITTYPILSICLGYFLVYIQKSKVYIRISFYSIATLLIILNQFQWWQYKNYILDPYRTTKEYYLATFLKTKVTDTDKELLLINRDFSGKMEFKEKERYQKSILLTEDFEGEGNKGNQRENNNRYYRIKADEEYYPIFETTYNELTQKDHLWINASMNIRFPNDYKGQIPCIVMTMERKTWAYGYNAAEIKQDTIKNQWIHAESTYLTPEIRSQSDKFKCYIWNRGKNSLDIDNIKIDIYKRK